MSMNQKEATFNAIINVMGEVDGVYQPTREQRAQVNLILFEGFRDGSIELQREFTDPELKAYVSGLQSNWLRKDTRLNGGTKYEAKNPGSRAGTGDSQLKALRALLATRVNPTERAEIQRYIDKRAAELKPATVTINVADIPEALRHLIKC